MPNPYGPSLKDGTGIFDQEKRSDGEDEQDPNDNLMDDSPPKITAEIPEGLVPIIPMIRGLSQPCAMAHVDNAAAAAASIVAQKSTRVRIKYVNCGVRATKKFFITPDKLSAYDMIPELLFLDGVVTAVPRRNHSENYTLNWTSTAHLPPSVDRNHLRSHVFRGDKEATDMLKSARQAYDQYYPNQQGQIKKKQKRSANSTSFRKSPTIPDNQTPSISSIRITQQSITGCRMSPLMDASICHADTDYQFSQIIATSPDSPNVTVNLRNDPDDSESEDGDDFEAGDTYFPLDGSDDIADPTYDPAFMETDGDYSNLLSGITYNYEELTDQLKQPTNMYNGKGPCLKEGIGQRFRTAFGCVQVCGGMNLTFLKRLTANANQYARANLVNDKFGGYKWRNITLTEMVNFKGVILKMSVDDRNLGGYKSYFEQPMSVILGQDYSVDLTNYPAWAAKVFKLYRFKQIRGALHPEVGTSSIGDKCHQLRYALNCLNHASKSTFIAGRDMSFDEGGVASRSRMCPVRQYNKDKPDKFRVDFFVLANNAPGKYFICHADVYQGKNVENIDIPEEIRNLPTTQKAVVNAVIKADIGKDPDGIRCLYMDNRYTAAQLLILLREQYDILGCGTTRQNRIGWPKELMNMSKKAPRGTNKTLYDKTNNILVGQWKDNKVVCYTSTLSVSGLVPSTRRVGANKEEFEVEAAL